MRFPWKRHALPPLPDGYEDYWASVKVRLHTPIPLEDEEDPRSVVGYFRNFGLRIRPDELMPVLEEAIGDGKILWDASEWYPIDPDSLDRVVRRRIVAVSPGGIWYVSGRVLYPGNADEDAVVQ